MVSLAAENYLFRVLIRTFHLTMASIYFISFHVLRLQLMNSRLHLISVQPDVVCMCNQHTTHPGAYCLGVFQNEDSTTILGGIVTRNMLVTYDRENDQIGFLRTKCTALWGTLFADSHQELDNSSSIPPFGRAGTDNVWINPPISVVSSHSPGSPNSPKTQSVKNHSDPVHVIPLKDVETSHASCSLPFLFSAPLMLRSLRHFHLPSIVTLVNTFWK